MKHGLIAGLTALFLASIGLTGCISAPEPVEIVDRVPILFTPTTDIEAAKYDASLMAMNFVYCLSKGDYETALKYVDIPSGVVFDAAALQRAMLYDGFGRGDSVTFYQASMGYYVTGENGEQAFISSSDSCSLEYDLSLSGATGEYSKKLPVVKLDDGSWAVDISSHIITGTLTFQVPMYVEVYINDTFIPQSFMGNNYIYTISAGVPKPISDDGEESDILTLTLKSKFGIEQSYDIFFQGYTDSSGNRHSQSSVSFYSVNDKYFNDDLRVSSFKIDVPREVRESALDYIEKTMLPTLLNDLLQGVSWDVTAFHTLFGADTNADAMKPRYYSTSTRFLRYTTQENGYYNFYPLSVYDILSSDTEAKDNGYYTRVVDYNTLTIYYKYSYNYLYTIGRNGSERNFTGTNRTVVSLGIDDDGNWYVKDLPEEGFRIGVD